MRSLAGFLLLVLFACLGFFPSNSAFAERRVALVIGNGQYEFIQKLPNPTRDSDAMADALRSLGFEVLAGNDLDRSEMVEIITKFDNLATDSNAAVIFYAGHAVQVNGENYLLPVSTIDADQQRQVTLGSVRLSELYEDVANKVDTTILLVDACRNDPFTRGLRGTGSTSRGLATLTKANSANGSFIGFATEPGDVAQDGTGLNSPYTTAILEHIATPDMDVHDMMARVGDRVRELTQNQQIPWVNTSLTSKGFMFKPVAAISQQAPTFPTPQQQSQNCLPVAVDDELWKGLSQANTAETYTRYLELCPNGSHALEAHQKIEDLANVPKWYLAIYGDVDFWGGDIHAKGVEAETAEDCARICGSDTACKLFSFNPEKKQCFPKSKLDLPVAYPGIVSGLFIEREAGSQDGPETPVVVARFRAFPGTAHSGPINPGWQTIGKTKSIDACLRACDREDSCRFVTFGDRQRNGSLCAQRFVGLFGDLFGKASQSGAIAFDRDQVEIAPAGELIPLPGLEYAR